jgi:RNA polymerase sigma-70 factor (ECF subfamily)
MASSLAARASAHDMDLVALSVGGNRDAFGELVRRHGSGVRALLRRMGADPATADDLAQDAFLAAFEQIADFRGEGAFAGWIKRIAARLYIRRWRRELRGSLTLEGPDHDLGGGQGADRGEAGANARIDLDEALKGLSDVERLCVSLCYGAGLSHTEAAAALNAPLGTVKSHVKRGLDKLKGRLAPESSQLPLSAQESAYHA